MLNSSFGKYLDRKSEVHMLNSTFKLMSLVIMLISSCFVNSYTDIIMLFSYLVLALVSSGIGLKIYLKEIWYFRFCLIFIVFVNIIFFSTFEALLVDLFRFAFVVLYTSMFIHVTTVNETMYAIGRMFDPFSIKKDDVMILYPSLIFRFPLAYIEEYNRLIRVYDDIYGSLSFRKKIMMKIRVLLGAFGSSIVKLNRAALFMKLKLFGYGKTRTNYRLYRYGVKEVMLLILNLAILLVVIIC